jgi:hypothetical protein
VFLFEQSFVYTIDTLLLKIAHHSLLCTLSFIDLVPGLEWAQQAFYGVG